MVLPLEHLAVLDLYLWLGNEGTVSEVLDVHKSTVSRQVRSALKLFNLKLSRCDGHVELGGDASLLMAERAVHQQARLRGRAPLRIDATYASGPWFLASPPEGWVVGRFDLPGVQRPLQLLEDRGVVLDDALDIAGLTQYAVRWRYGEAPADFLVRPDAVALCSRLVLRVAGLAKS